jgi:hypothetical protein
MQWEQHRPSADLSLHITSDVHSLSGQQWATSLLLLSNIYNEQPDHSNASPIDHCERTWYILTGCRDGCGAGGWRMQDVSRTGRSWRCNRPAPANTAKFGRHTRLTFNEGEER